MAPLLYVPKERKVISFHLALELIASTIVFILAQKGGPDSMFYYLIFGLVQVYHFAFVYLYLLFKNFRKVN